MLKSQTINHDSSKTRLHKLTLRLFKQKETYDRLKIGKDLTCCEMFAVLKLNDIVCKNLCYEDKEMEIKVNDYLVKNI